MRFLIPLLLSSLSCLAQFPLSGVTWYNPPAAAGGGGGGLAIAHAWKGVTATTPLAVTVSPSAGNLLVVCGSSNSGDVSSISDNIGGTTGWTKVGSSTQSSFAWIWYKKNIPGGITSISIAAVDFISATVNEVSGASASAPFTIGESGGNNSNSGTTNPQTPTVNNATAASIYFAVLNNADGANPVTYTINGTGTSGTWSLFSSTQSQELDANDWQPFSNPYMIVSSSASRKHGWTTSSFAYMTFIAAFH